MARSQFVERFRDHYFDAVKPALERRDYSVAHGLLKDAYFALIENPRIAGLNVNGGPVIAWSLMSLYSQTANGDTPSRDTVSAMEKALEDSSQPIGV